MKVAVTQASGQLGSAIVKQLIHDIGHDSVIGIARTPAKAAHLGVEIRKGDYNSEEDFNQALQGVEAVLIVSGNDYPEKRIEQHRNIIRAAQTNQLERIVYVSIMGNEQETDFSPIIKSNRQTEADVKASGLSWAIGRNGLYIEPDLEYVEQYVKNGGISNSAGDGLCAYTSRGELAYAYSRMLLEDQHHGQTYNLLGEPITQTQLADYINQTFGSNLTYTSVPVADYLEERKAALGEFLGTVIGGIYEGIRNGAFNSTSDFTKAAGRPHKTALTIMQEFKQAQEGSSAQA